MRLIDLHHQGVPQTIACWRVDDLLVDCGPESCLTRLVDELDGWRPRALVLTHIHLDHAGAAGALAHRWPGLVVYVHERGAPHLVDPRRLRTSVERIYGELTQTVYGTIEPVPAESVRPLRGGERIGPLEVAYTPGHASHHVSFLHESGCAFVGDAVGVRIGGASPIVPHAPPPDIDLESWEETLGVLRSWAPTSLALSHFGVVQDAEIHIEQMATRLRETAELARRHSLDEFVRDAEKQLRSLPNEVIRAYRQTAPPEHSYAGLRRYWTKRHGSGKAE